MLAGGGLSVVCLAGAQGSPRRYALLLGLIALVLLTHSVPAHKEYRFIFVVIPRWLLIGSDLAVRGAAWVRARWPARPAAARWTLGAAGALFAAASCAGVEACTTDHARDRPRLPGAAATMTAMTA